MSDRQRSGTGGLSPTKRALRALRDMRDRLDAVERGVAEPVAIVGMGCRFPKAAGLRAYWRLLAGGEDAVSEVPAERWDTHLLYDPDPSVRGKSVSRHGGFLDDLDRFDPEFFGISPREAPHVDPRQRLLLEVAWEALEDAGVPADSLAGTRTAVYVATLTNDYDQILARDPGRFEIYSGTGTANSVVANRLSYTFDLQGPSVALDTACSGSLQAIHLACQSLRTREASLALAGGVSVNLLPNGDILFSRAGTLSPDGRCQTFDRKANGIVRSEGAGLVVLKLLSRALADGDRVHAVIRGSAVNHTGRSAGIMAPDRRAQAAVLAEAYRQAGVSPGRVQYVEAHGTGTRAGDPIEVQALLEVLSEGRSDDLPLVLGSVKTNLGHTEAAAGVAGVIKTALALSHGFIPPNLHLEELNPALPTARFPLVIPDRGREWPAEPSGPEDGEQERIAGVSGFGFGGANAHVVLQEAPPPERPASGGAEADPDRVDAARTPLLTLSAAEPEALEDLAAAWIDFLAGRGAEIPLQDLLSTAAVRRTHLGHRLAVAAPSREELEAHLAGFLRGEDDQLGWVRGTSPSRDRGAPEVVFAFSGQGAHWHGMGRALLDTEPSFREVIDACDERLRELAGWSLLEQLRGEGDGECRDDIDVVQPSLFAVQVGLAALWRSRGVEPDRVVGQSLGEVAAAHVAGALSLDDAVAVIHHRSRLLRRVAGQGASAAVGLAPEAVRERLAGREESLGIAGHTAPRTSIVSGEPAALDELLGELEADEVFCRLLANVDAAAHSPQMDPLIGELEELLAGLSPGPARLPFHSTVDAEELPGERLDAAYWARNLRQPFRLAEVVAELIRQGPPVFLEAGPEPVLAGAIRQSLLDLGAEGFPVASLREGDDARRSLLMGLGGLHVQGVRLDWRRLHPGESRCVALPTYPWRRRRHWLDQLPGGATGPGGRRSGAHPLLGDGVEPARPGDPRLWQTELEARSLHYLREHRVQGQVVFPGAAYLEMALAAGTAGGAPALGVEEVCFERGLLLAEGEPRRIQLVAEPSRRGEEIFEIYSRDLEADGEGPAAPDGASGAWTLHARGVLRTAGGTDGPEPLAPAGLDGLRERCAEPVPAGELYASMRARGLEHGPAFQAVRSLWRGASESLAELELDPRVASELGSYRLHPVLLDACLHGIAAALPPSGDEQDRETYLPWKIGRLRRFRPPGPRGWCHARLAPGSRPGLDTLVADVRLFDPDGQPVAELEGVSLRRLEAAAGRARRPVEDDLYRVDWVPADPPPHDGNDGPDTWLLFTDGDGVGGELADQVERAGGTAIRIRRGAGGADGGGGEGADFTLEAPTREAYERLFAEVLGAGSGPRRLVHLGSLDRPAGPDVAAELCAEVTAMLQALTGSPEAEARPSRLWLVTHGAQPVDGRPEMASPAGTALWGLGRSIAHEHPEHWGGLVELDTPQPTLAANRLRDELVREGSTGPTGSTGSTRSGREVAFFGGRRHEARLVRWRPSGPPLPVGFRRDASYLITGGLAGLGLETARWMVRRGARRLVLVGRTPLPERREWASVEEGSAAGRRIAAVRELEAMGAAVHVASVDVGDEDALGALLERHRRECLPPIRGVVHSAGVLRDRLLVRMEAGDFEAVFRPKAHAAWFLHHLTAGLELDFFLLYASVASVLGHLGQANHAAANAYLDGLAHHRRGLGLPATSIDWGPWAEIGGFAREQAEGAATASGMEPFTPARGIEALERIFESGPAQVTATDADWTAMAGLPLVADLAAAGRAPGASGPGGGAGDADGEPETSGLLELLLAPPDERRALLQEELLRATARVLRTDPARIDPAKPLTTLGMESVMAVELKNSVESRLGLTIPVVDLFSGSVAGLAEKLSAGLEEDERFADLLEELESFEAAAPEDLEVGE